MLNGTGEKWISRGRSKNILKISIQRLTDLISDIRILLPCSKLSCLNQINGPSYLKNQEQNMWFSLQNIMKDLLSGRVPRAGIGIVLMSGPIEIYAVTFPLPSKSQVFTWDFIIPYMNGTIRFI